MYEKQKKQKIDIFVVLFIFSYCLLVMKHSGKASSPVIRALFVILGLVSFGLGVLGIFLPLLPTTPFLLLSAYLFVRSSNRLYQWLINHQVFGRYINDYLEKRSIPKRVKWYTLALLWTSILWCIASLELGNLQRIMLLFIAVGVTIHVAKLRNSD